MNKMKEGAMSWASGIMLMLGMASPALAADYDLPILRGSQPPAPVVSVGNLHAPERLLFRRQCQPRQRNIRLFHGDAAAGPIQLAAPDGRRASASLGFSGPQ